MFVMFSIYYDHNVIYIKFTILCALCSSCYIKYGIYRVIFGKLNILYARIIMLSSLCLIYNISELLCYLYHLKYNIYLRVIFGKLNILYLRVIVLSSSYLI